MMKKYLKLYEELCRTFRDKAFLKEAGLSRKEMDLRLMEENWKSLSAEILQTAGADGRFHSRGILTAARDYILELRTEPEGGWQQHCYKYVLGQLFPEMGQPEESAECRRGRAWYLQILRAVYNYERQSLPFDPTKNMEFLTDGEIEEKGYTEEYIRMHKLVKAKYVYEFMRIGIDITPFNTLGHIGGVHYVSMFVARQLSRAGVPCGSGPGVRRRRGPRYRQVRLPEARGEADPLSPLLLYRSVLQPV